jgi:hypothetical protein
MAIDYRDLIPALSPGVMLSVKRRGEEEERLIEVETVCDTGLVATDGSWYSRGDIEAMSSVRIDPTAR